MKQDLAFILPFLASSAFSCLIPGQKSITLNPASCESLLSDAINSVPCDPQHLGVELSYATDYTLTFYCRKPVIDEIIPVINKYLYLQWEPTNALYYRVLHNPYGAVVVHRVTSPDVSLEANSGTHEILIESVDRYGHSVFSDLITFTFD